MLYTLQNDTLTATVSTLGAEMCSVKRGACEYIWQGDPAYWSGKNPLLFPICGRLAKGKYTYGGREYEMQLHGFVRKLEFACLRHTDTEIELRLTDNEQTRAVYPFAFALTISYRLCGSRVELRADMENCDANPMPATFGGHPGFRVPLDGDSDFSEWFLEFGEECDPNAIEIAPSGLQTGLRTAYPLQNRRILPLSHDLFRIDGIFLARMASSVTLRSHRCERSVTLRYPDMPYLGIWHAANTDAPFVCIEPWCGLPDFDGRVRDLTQKSELFHIPPQASQTVGFDMIFD